MYSFSLVASSFLALHVSCRLLLTGKKHNICNNEPARSLNNFQVTLNKVVLVLINVHNKFFPISHNLPLINSLSG